MSRVKPLSNVRWREDRQKWQAEVVISYDGLTKKRISKLFDLLEDANDWKREHDKKKQHGGLSSDAVLTTAEWCKEWLDEKKCKNLAARTLQDYDTYITKWIIPFLGAVRLSELTPRRLQKYLNEVRAKTTQYTTHRARHHLAMILESAFELELINRNPVKKVKFDKPKSKPALRWTREESAKILTHCLNPTTTNRIRYFVAFALLTGERREELLGGRWADINWQARKVKIEQVCIYLTGKWTLKPNPKNNSSEREMFIEDDALTILKLQAMHVAKMKAAKTGKKISWQEHDLIFPSSRGTPMSEKRLRDEFNALCLEAGVPIIEVRRTRATYNSVISLDLRSPPKLVADRMGHSDEMTQVKYYQSVSDDQRRSLALGLITLYGVEIALETVSDEAPIDDLNTPISAQNPHKPKSSHVPKTKEPRD
jgi:integrase